uniref:NADH-ubiquinone oxidoreductase chain 5 n=1 Tax=Linyphia triangularis TaxID=94031 RepID=A0A7L7S6W0_LINTI|nr:NADH dehydrogenase subunit 5 [Linyphia triangularis]
MFFYIMIPISIMALMLSLFLLNNSIFISMDIPIWTFNSFNFSFSMLVDFYSMMFSSAVIMISSMIMIFSLNYIPMKELKQFFMIMMMFIISMIILILSDNIMFILLGWDGLGLSSFILVVYYQNFSSASSGLITIFSNRLGDIAILISMSVLAMKMNWNFFLNEEYPKLVLILLLTAAISKSAQFPFSSWLPAAMAAPTPISALVHSSTLVTAGVYLMIRILNFNHPNVMMILLIISTMTTIYASMTANWEQDLKKIIALSTLSQIGMMMFAVAMSSYQIAFFHLIIHAMFKSMMFLCAGMMIHNYAYQDMRHMNLMKNSSPTMFLILIISNMTLMGLPFMSGFFSKDAIIEAMIESKMFSLLTMIMIFSIGMTASYSMRMIKLATKMTMKSKTDNMFSNSAVMEMAMIMMVPFSIFLGAMMSWMINPTQIFIFPKSIKIMIITMMLMGVLMGTNMNFKSKNFYSVGHYSISLWFMNYLSTHFYYFLTPLMLAMQKNDKYWQEMYGPRMINVNLKMSETNPETNLNFPASLMMLVLMMPILIMTVQ